MFEGIVARALNSWLGKYVADLDTERLNVGIFSGRVCLADLRLKPEALYELGLPIEVKTGSVGKLELVIPWGSLRAQPVVVVAEDVLVLVGPAGGRDPERERRLLRAEKRCQLEALEAEGGSRRALADLLAALLHNLHISVRNVHVRYEDATSSEDGPFAAGFCLQSLCVETTNSKWKPSGTSSGGGGGGGGGSVYQMVRVEAVSAYWNARATVLDERETGDMTPIQYYNWKHHMLSGLRTFSVHGEPFNFMLRPVSCKVKVIVKECGGGGGGGGGDARAPLLLVDAVLQDGGVQVQRAQLLSIRSLLRAFRRINIARKYRGLWPGGDAVDAGGARAWWRYAYEAVLEQRVRPYTWAGVRRHRRRYNLYKQAYKAVLRSPTDTELRLDLHKCEDELPILSAVVAREHAKMELAVEEPSRVEVAEGGGGRGAELRVRGARVLVSLWSQLSSPEKPASASPPAQPRNKQFIEHKVNVTLGNWSVTLSHGGAGGGDGAGGGGGGREVLVVTLAHFVASLETRPAPGAYKISARVESVTVEGASGEGEMVSLMWADPVPPPAAPPANLLSLDWERRPPSGEADYALVAAMEPIEIVYHEHALSEVLRFLEGRDTRRGDTARAARRRAGALCSSAAALVQRALKRTKLLSINLDFKGICLVLPEHGSIHRPGSVLVVEAGRVTVRSELQPSSPALEDATCMELEERLYDRLHADCPALQVLFCEEGERWRELRKQPDSELHLLPRLRLQLVFSNTIVPTYVSLPRHKLNVTISSLKLNISERIVARLVDFAEHLPPPLYSDLIADHSQEPTTPAELTHLFQLDQLRPDPSFNSLLRVRAAMVAAYISTTRDRDGTPAVHGERGDASAAPARAASEPSDDDVEVFARTVDLPGFDDNVSPTNTIRVLLRFVLGEIVVNVSRCTPPETSERAYAMAAVSGVCVDAALMEYGPAVQLSARSLLLSDKLHRAAAGQYLHLISAGHTGDEFLNLLYRKVRADCPDFKTHFHSVERSLVADVGAVNFAVHADALHHLHNYTLHLYHTVRRPHVLRACAAAAGWWRAMRERAGAACDPPVPLGATKFSYSARVSTMSARLYHLDSEVLEARTGGLESDCVFKANDRLIFKLFLGTLQVDHLADLTLYPKLVWGDEDKVLEMKYVRHTPRVYTPQAGGAAAALGGGGSDGGGASEADGSLKLYLGRMHVVVLYKMLLDLQHMWETLSTSGLARWAVCVARKRTCAGWARARDARLALAIDVRAPTLLLPRGYASPDLLVLNCGDLVVENFFKKVSASSNVVDNILLRLANVTLARAVMTLAGALHLQEAILEPMEIRVDVKRRRGCRGGCGDGGGGGAAPVEADASLDTVLVNLGRRDLATLLAVTADYWALATSLAGRISTGANSTTDVEQTDIEVEKLQAFFAKAEPIRKETSLRLSVEGAQVRLFNDAEEVLSSPVREAGRGVARLAAPELSLHLYTYSDKSLELRAALHSLKLEDMRSTPTVYFERVTETGEEDEEGGISVWSPPLAELTWRRAVAGDRSLHLQVERTRLYFAVPFFVHLARFLLDATPGERALDVTGGVINHGYEGEPPGDITGEEGDMRPPSSPDSTSGCCSSGTWKGEESPGLTVCIRFRRPELVLLADVAGGGGKGRALLVRAELLVDFSRHAAAAAGETFTVSLSGLEAAWRTRSTLASVLRACDVELSRSCRSAEEGVRAALSVSAVDVRLSPPILHTIADIVEELRCELSVPEATPPVSLDRGEPEDLWSPRKLEPLELETSEPRHNSPDMHPPARAVTMPETFTLSASSVRVTVQLQPSGGGAVLLQASLECSVHEWSGRAHGGGTLVLHASLYNERLNVWEPLLEPACRQDGVRTPWRIHCHFFPAKSYPMWSKLEGVSSPTAARPAEKTRAFSGPVTSARRAERRKRCSAGSGTSADEAESDGEMCFIRSRVSGNERRGGGSPFPMRSALPVDDSEDEGGHSDKLAAAVTQLFADSESSGEDSSEGAESSSAERSEPEHEPEDTADTDKELQTNTPAPQERVESTDSGMEEEENWIEEQSATYAVVHARDTLNLTVTPHAVSLLTDLIEALADRARAHAIIPHSNSDHLELLNDIGPGATVELVSRTERDLMGQERVLTTAEWDADADTSRASSPSLDNLDRRDPVSDRTTSNTTQYWHWPQGDARLYRATPAPVDESEKETAGNVTTMMDLYEKLADERVVLRLRGKEELRAVRPRRDLTLLYSLTHTQSSNVRYHVRLEQSTRAGSRVLLLRSPLQVCNETSYPLELLYRKTDLETLGLDAPGELTNPFDDKLRLAVIEPHHTYNVPLHVAYHCPLFLLPSNLEAYRPATRGIWWKELATEPETPRDIICRAKVDTDTSVFALRVLIAPGAGGDPGVATRGVADIPDYTIRAVPPLALHNRLPYAVQLDLAHIDYRLRLEAGERTRTHLVDLTQAHKVRMEMSYRGVCWSGELTLSSETHERRVRMRGEGGRERPAVCVRLQRGDSWDLFFHAPYWIINKTGLPLHMKVSRCDSTYEVGDEPLLFGEEWRGMGAAAARRTVRLRAHLSAWSRAFSVDAVGAPGLVVCHHRERRRKYRILLESRLSELCPQLTRIVSLLPYYTVHNDTRRHLRFMEENEAADLWMDLAPGQCVPFWPETESMRLHCKLRDSPGLSQHVPLAHQHFTVLRMDKGSALSVEVTGGDSAPWAVRFRSYRVGDAPVRVLNLTCDLFIKLHQRDSPQVVLLSPQHSTLYTWDDPCAERTLLCNVYNNKSDGFVVNIHDDGFGEEKVSLHSIKHSPLTQTNSVTSKLSSTLKRFTPRARSPEPRSSSGSGSGDESETDSTVRKAARPDTQHLYWVSYRDGVQRVLALTDDERVARRFRARLASLQRSDTEIYISLAGLGLSLCTQYNSSSEGVRELAYLSLSGSAPRWEANLSRRWRPLAPDLTAAIEERYSAPPSLCFPATGGSNEIREIKIRDYVHADLDRMHMTKPFFSELRRTYIPALWLQLRRSSSLTHVRVKIHRVQLDDQRPDAVFPCVIHAAPALTVRARPRPCLHLFVSHRRNPPFYECVDLNVKPYCINLDREFVRHTLNVLSGWRGEDHPAPAVRLRVDLALVHAPLASLVSPSCVNTDTQSSLFHRINISPLSCILSLSRGRCVEDPVACAERRGGRERAELKTFNSDLLEFLLDSWGSTIGDIKDVQLRSSAMEMGSVCGGWSAARMARRHCTTHLLQQFHAAVLGRDVLSNRCSTHTHSQQDEEEATEGNVEIGDVAHKLEYGVSVLLGYCASGAPRAAPLLADCPPAAAAALRRTRVASTLSMTGWCPTPTVGTAGGKEMEEPPRAAPHPAELALALTGLVARPASAEDCTLFRNVYREAVATARQREGGAGGVADWVEWALRAAEERSGGRLVARRRLPRHCHPHQGVGVYSPHAALGQLLLCRLSRGHYAGTDTYLAHAALAPHNPLPAPDTRRALLLTTRRVMLVRAGSGGGGGGVDGGSWRVEWAAELEELASVPEVRDNKLIFTVKQGKWERGGDTEAEERVVQCAERQVLLWLRASLHNALLHRLEQHPCPPLL